jgi:hypothetical protein
MADWHLAPSLAALFDEVNARWPNRDHGSDGAKGDDAHAGRVSDHNPDWSAGGVVRAIDVDKDGIDVQQLLDATVRDQRVAYVIWNRRIASATDDGIPWDWEPYNGPNPHDHHIHISIKHTTAAETDTSPWFEPNQEDKVTEAQAAELLDLNRKILRELQGINARVGYVANDGMKDLDRAADTIAGKD